MIDYQNPKSQAKELVDRFLEKAQYHEVGRYMECLDSLSPEVRLQGIHGLKRIQFYSHDVDPLLEDANAQVRKGALAYFKTQGGLTDAPKAEKLLEDPQDSVRAMAVDALYTLSSDKAKIEPLLSDASPEVRFSAIKALEEVISDDQLLPFLQDFSEKIRHYALEIKIQRTSDPHYLCELIDQEPPTPLKKKALRQLAIFDPPKALERIRKIASDPTRPPIERKAVILLLKDFPAESAAAIIDPWIADSVSMGGSITLLPAIIQVFASIHQDQPSKVVSTLSSLFDTQDEKVKEAVIKGLSKLGESSISPLLRQALEDASPKVRACAVEGLTTIMDYYLADQIPALLEDYSERVRKSAIQAIGKLKLEDFYMDMVERITKKKEDAKVRMAAISMCKRNRIQEALDSIITLLMDETQPLRVRNLAGNVLLILAPQRVIETLQETSI